MVIALGKPLNNRWLGDRNASGQPPLLEAHRLAHRSRVFSLGDREAPLCTLHVSLMPLELVEAQGRPGESILEQTYYPALIEAVAYLKGLLPGLVIDRRLPLRLLDVASAGHRTCVP